MSLSEYARTFAGRWVPRRRTLEEKYHAHWTFIPAATRKPRGTAPEAEIGTERPAATLLAGDDILVADRWVRIETAEPIRQYEGSFMQLRLAGGAILTEGYQSLVMTRDAEEQARAAAAGRQVGS